ncbi:right-handed parallel beta-helix repeat-containing protein [Mariniflexile sp. AS56]|uniref:right-handed parallel beta-helix repeat-containing protein n=1 Tax=Mariniflexile sp. AS56 TaxID=3063957 RepID=UPI0026ED3179|nr:right-handed parallel beta-helix repeat-containing protein [Mariniflexile sp. AS56]MDO7171357.1 right-handed parallel beta-helix repeat-containing protein [Mariniflexile sp. AS56]
MMIRPMYLVFFVMISLVSCNSEELFKEPTSEIVLDNETPEDTDSTTEANASTPCDFTLNNVAANSTIIINCVLDLNGESITLPTNVTVVYEGGSIINGTINFSNGNTIDGDLLNSTLILGGTTPLLKDPTFNFDPKRWGIVEGKVTDAVALRNKTLLQNTIDKTKEMGVQTFTIDNMDAYFAVGISSDVAGVANNALHLPSDFNLIMTDNTFLRVQPNAFPFSVLLTVFENKNVTITGGNLIGDRWEHEYVTENVGTYFSHEWPMLLQFASAENIVADGVYMADATGDGLSIANGRNLRYEAGAKFNKNILIKNCTTTRSRRNNVSITDGENITLENCIITDAGIGTQSKDANGNTIQFTSAGVLPRTGIDIEPYMDQDENGNLRYYARAQYILIKGCTFTGNSNSSIIDYTGEDVVIEGNFSDNEIGAHHGWRTKFINNTLVASEANKSVAGISTGDTNTYEVIGNSISGFNIGIEATGDTGLVANNTIRDFGAGIAPKNANNFIFENNDIEGANAVGISGYGANGNMIFRNNKIVVDKSPMNWQVSNNTTESLNYTVLFDNNQFIARVSGPSYVYINQSPNVTVKNSTLTKARFLVRESNNFVEVNNTLN